MERGTRNGAFGLELGTVGEDENDGCYNELQYGKEDVNMG